MLSQVALWGVPRSLENRLERDNKSWGKLLILLRKVAREGEGYAARAFPIPRSVLVVILLQYQ